MHKHLNLQPSSPVSSQDQNNINMSNPEESKNHAEQAHHPTSTSAYDVEHQPVHEPAAANGFGVSGILGRWRREDMIRKGALALRGLAFLFSFLSFIITASNQHGPGSTFKDYEEYKYLLAIAILSTLYAGAQTLRHVHQISTGKYMFQDRTSALIDFMGDQVMAYFLISSTSAAIPMTDRIRIGGDSAFSDSTAAAISMSFFAFVCLAVSALSSGYKLSTQSYI